ncbi:hypothetical protein HMPREF7215_1537 [Pyramidobacter piscolens W5455]|uniref:Uncharacterized protein n=1 Tax=Pyramidobacter piscolens W5455 TaxID=352165 RepID=A0ABM9ZX37_9BACT|nr:hypothetical protein HMPREF7215_1537 [Pyramidobacter piscolens W5455]
MKSRAACSLRHGRAKRGILIEKQYQPRDAGAHPPACAIGPFPPSLILSMSCPLFMPNGHA